MDEPVAPVRCYLPVDIAVAILVFIWTAGYSTDRVPHELYTVAVQLTIAEKPDHHRRY